MADELTATGLSIDDLETRRAIKVARLRAAISPILDVSPDQPIGIVTDIANEHDQQLAELLQEVYSALDPDQATGMSLDAVCSLTGTYRRAATSGTVELSVDLDAATTLPAGSQVAVAGDPDNIWATDVDVTSVGAGVYAVLATCLTTGPVQALAGTLTVIVTPVVGWNSVTNAADADEGSGVEGATALRLRRLAQLALGGSTSTAAIHADLATYSELAEIIVIENDLDRVVDGIPAHAIEVIYWDGIAGGADTDVIGGLILGAKAGGIRAHGTTFVTIVILVGAESTTFSIGMTRATPLTMQLEYTLDTDPEDYPGDAAFQAAMADLDAVYQTIGANVLEPRWLANAFTVDGVLDVDLRLRFAGDAWGTIDLPVGTRQIATLSSADVTVL